MPDDTTIILAPNGSRGDYRRWGKCSRCGRDVFWCSTASGARIPFKSRPRLLWEHADGKQTVARQGVHFDRCGAKTAVAEHGSARKEQ